MSVFLSGATGFLGGKLLKRLLEEGESVRVLVRKPSAFDLKSERLKIVQGDLCDPEALEEALGDASRVYHLAAAVKEWVKDWTVFERVNVDGFESLLKIAMARGVERVVYTSSFMALGHSDLRGVGDENLVHEAKHFHNPYEKTKHQAFLIGQDYLQRGAPLITVIPGVIFGPGELTEGNLIVQMLRDMAHNRFPGIPGDGKKLWSYAFVDDVVEGHLSAMRKGKIGERYILGGENISLNSFVDQARKHLGVKVPTRHLPLKLLDISAFFMERLARLTGKPPLLTRGKVGVLAHSWAYSSEKAVEQLDYRITPFEEALSLTIRWMRERNLIS